MPLDVGPQDLLARQYDRAAVHEIFDNLQFRVLRERLLATFEQEDETTSDEGFDIDGGVLAAGAVRGWLAAHAYDGRVGMVCHGTFGAGAGDLHQVVLAAEDGAAGIIDVTTLSTDDDAALGDWLADPAAAKVGHDIKPAVNALTHRGWTVRGIASDTALAAYLALPGQRTFDLGDLVQRYLHRSLDTQHRRRRWSTRVDRGRARRHRVHGDGPCLDRSGCRAGGGTRQRQANSRCWPTWNSR